MKHNTNQDFYSIIKEATIFLFTLICYHDYLFCTKKWKWFSSFFHKISLSKPSYTRLPICNIIKLTY